MDWLAAFRFLLAGGFVWPCTTKTTTTNHKKTPQKNTTNHPNHQKMTTRNITTTTPAAMDKKNKKSTQGMNADATKKDATKTNALGAGVEAQSLAGDVEIPAVHVIREEDTATRNTTTTTYASMDKKIKKIIRRMSADATKKNALRAGVEYATQHGWSWKQ